MAAADLVHHVEVKDLIEFSQEKRVRKDLARSPSLMTDFTCFEPGQEGLMHSHPDRDENFYVIDGEGSLVIEDEGIPVEQGSFILVPAGVRHMARADRDSRFVVMFTKGAGIAEPPP